MPGANAMTSEGIEAAQNKADEIEREQKQSQAQTDAAYIIIFRQWAKENGINIQHKKNEQTAFEVWRLIIEELETLTDVLKNTQKDLEDCQQLLEK